MHLLSKSSEVKNSRLCCLALLQFRARFLKQIFAIVIAHFVSLYPTNSSAGFTFKEYNGDSGLLVTVPESQIPCVDRTLPRGDNTCTSPGNGLVFSYRVFSNPPDGPEVFGLRYLFCNGALGGDTCPTQNLYLYFDGPPVSLPKFQYLELRIEHWFEGDPWWVYPWWLKQPYVLQQTFLISDIAVTTKNAGPPDPDNCIGNPIHAKTANKYQAEIDYAGHGVFPLAFSRHHNSQNGEAGILGTSWNSFSRLSVNANSLKAMRANGRILTFNLVNGQWRPDADITDTLEQLPDGRWRYTTTDTNTEIYSANGKLLQVTNRQGLSHNYAYMDSPRSQEN